MSNWCENELYISIPDATDEEEGKKEIQRFKEFAATKKGKETNLLDTNKFVPYPAKYRKADEAHRKAEEELSTGRKEGLVATHDRLPKDGFNNGGYEWCTENWGTKWGICNAELVNDGDTYLDYEFRTAWSPPEPVVHAMSKKFPKLKFDLRYFEGGAGFNGILICENGEIKENKTGEYFGSRGG